MSPAWLYAYTHLILDQKVIGQGYRPVTKCKNIFQLKTIEDDRVGWREFVLYRVAVQRL